MGLRGFVGDADTGESERLFLEGKKPPGGEADDELREEEVGQKTKT